METTQELESKIFIKTWAFQLPDPLFGTSDLILLHSYLKKEISIPPFLGLLGRKIHPFREYLFNIDYMLSLSLDTEDKVTK